MGKDKLIPVIAMILLLIGVSAAIYVHATQINKDTITIKGEEYTIDQIFTLAEKKTVTTDEGEITGVSLEDLMKKAGVSCTSCSTYTFKAEDGYSKTISYNILETGILTKERRVIFPDEPHALWVQDVIEIEVK